MNKVVDYVSDKTNTKVGIDRLFVTFSGNIFLEGLYLEDKKGDTLLYSKTLEANLPISPIILGNGIDLKSLEWEGLKAQILRDEGTEDFNFDFLLVAFISNDSLTPPPESKPLDITIGSVTLVDFEIDYRDRYLGIESELSLGKLDLEMDKIDLATMRFEIDELSLYDTNIIYKQTKPFSVAEDTEETQLPYLVIRSFALENSTANYNSIPDKVLANVDIGNFQLELPKANLSENDFEIGKLALNKSTISLAIGEQQLNDSIEVEQMNSTFAWPSYLVQVEQIDFKNSNFKFLTEKQQPTPNTFNTSDVEVSNVILKAKNLKYGQKEANLKLENFSFKEKSGFQLKELVFDAKVEDTFAEISNLKLQTNYSTVVGDLALQFPTIQKLIDAPDATTISLNIPNINLDLRDVFIFQPDLIQNEYVEKASLKSFTGNLSADGTLEAMKISDMQIAWGENTSLLARGALYNITNTDSLTFDFSQVVATSKRKDVLGFISEKDLGISVPKTITINAFASGGFENIKGEMMLKIPEGRAKLAGIYRKRNKIEFAGNLKVDSLQLDKLLNNEQLGDISFRMKAAGGGNSINTLNAIVDSDFTQLKFNNYDFSNLLLTGKIKDGKGDIDFNFKDENLNVQAKTQVNLDTISSAINLKINVIGADLFALGITQENIKVGTKINVNFIGTSDDFELNASLNQGIAVFDNEQYQIDAIDFVAKIDENTTEMTIDSGFLNGNLMSNGSPEQINSALQKQFKSYFSDVVVIDSTSNHIAVTMNALLNPTPILTKVFLKGVEKLDSVSLKANFDAATKKINASLRMPAAKYNGSTIDSLDILVTGNASNLNFKAGLAGFSADPIQVKQTYFEGNLKNNDLALDFISFDDKEKLVHIASEMTLVNDTINLHINPSELVLNKKAWTIPQDNRITIGDRLLHFKNIKLAQDEQELTIGKSLSEINKDNIAITFDNFKLQTFLSLLNPDEALATGLVAGNLIIESPFGATGIIADFKINELAALQNPLGNLSLEANSKELSQYDFNLSLKDGNLDMDLIGDYTAAESGAKLNLDLDLNKLEIKAIEEFSEEIITDSEGFISGNMKVTGTTEKPEYQGNLTFNETEFKVTDLNSVFKISNESLKVDNSGFYVDSFVINDVNSNSFTLDGTIFTKKLTNPTFDLALQAERFQVMNSTKEDNDLFYGKASMNADISIKGDLALPILKGKLRVRDVTDVTYIVPESELDIEERDGVVIFVNNDNPDAILTRNDQEETPSLFRGIQINAILEIADDAVFNIVIDERAGDNLKVSGDAALNLNVESSGRINLTGRYELNAGHYETSLYNLVKRRFEINPGSTITWLGDPADAQLDVTAVYSVKTSAAPLMTAVTSGQDASLTNKFNQVLAFLVYLNVDGELLEPELSFGMDMPENVQGSLDGAVYSRIQQLNTQESELNKQVFSLLALNRFFPDSGSDGSSGGTAALARNNVNKVLSGELNAFTDKIFGNSGFELDFDLDSFTDYQGDSPQDRTQLNINAKKKLFNDRLIVTAGSAVDVEGSAQSGQDETPIIGNVSLEYLLTKNGIYRLKGFRKKEYQNVIDGQLILTGVALIFNREFNRFSELFNPLPNAKKIEKKAKKDDQEKNLEPNKNQ